MDGSTGKREVEALAFIVMKLNAIEAMYAYPSTDR